MPTGPTIRVVLDTNVVVAGMLWNGAPRRLLAQAVTPGTGPTTLQLFASTVLLDELEHTLSYPKFAPRINSAGTTPQALVTYYSALVQRVTPTDVPRVVAGDPDDDHVLAAAVAARAAWIVTGDRKHLLPLGVHRGIEILAPADAWLRISN